MGTDEPRTVSRRAVLTSLGVAGGAGIALGAIGALGLADDGPADTEPVAFTPPAPSDFTLQGRDNDQSVVVLGSGIAGLCCAYELVKAGYEVTVVEAADRAGGRNWTARDGTNHTDTNGDTQRCEFANERWFNTGPARIAQHHTTLDYCHELGVPVEVFVNANIDAYIAQNGVVRRRRSVVADHDGYVAELLAKCIRADALDGEFNDAEISGLRDYLGLWGALGRSDRGFVEAPGIDAGVVEEPDPLAEILNLGLGSRLNFEKDWHQAMPMFHPVGGMDRIVDALVAAIGDDHITLSTEATEVVETSDGVRVVGTNDMTIDADFGVCALQPGIARALDNPWSREVNDALGVPQKVRTGKIGLEYDARFWERQDRIFGGTSTTDPDVRVIWYPSTDYHAEGGVIMGAYPFGGFATGFGRATPEEREELAVARGEEIHGPHYRDDLRSSFSIDWDSVPNVQSAWTSRFSYGSDYQLLQAPVGRWFFAGDWMSHTPGWQHGAFESARHAVSELHQLALAS